MLLWQLVVFIFLSETALLVQPSTLYYRKENSASPVVKQEPTINERDKHVYLFVTDGNKRPYGFIDDFGKLVGFDVDIVNKVCSIAGKRCHTILAEFTECIFTDRNVNYAGRGLMAGWFDGCPGYQITNDRLNEFDFTLPYLDSSASFTVAPGNPSQFYPDSDDYSRFKLLHLTGAPTNIYCLKKLHKKFGQILIAQNLPEAKALLLNGTADVLFSPRNEIEGLEVLPQRVRCDNGGAGIMLRKASTVPSWWNPAFKKFFFSGEYSKLCSESAEKYKGKIHCLPPPQEISQELSTLLSTPQVTVSERLWRFVVTGRIAPYSYLNDEGKLVGFTKDMIESVCKVAGKQCILLLAQVHECTLREGEFLYPGRGLMENWFDACTGYYNTPERHNSWDLTSPYLVSNASFYVVQGNPSGFDPDSDDYSAFTIVYTATAITNNHCLNRLHKKFNKLIETKTEEEAIEMVLNRTADAWFTKEDDISQLDLLPQHLHCEDVGTSILTKKGSDLPFWWNLAFEKFYSSGKYSAFCEEEGRLHNTSFPCLEGPKKPGNMATKTVEGF